MSRVGWLSWGNAAAKSAEHVDDVDDEAAVDKILQTQLHSEQHTSQDFSQESPLLQKKKRKSREINGDGEGADKTHKQKRKKKRRKSRAESNDDVGDFSTSLNTVLAHMDGTIGSERSSSQVERRPAPRIVLPPVESNGPSKTPEISTKAVAAPAINGHGGSEISDDSDGTSIADIQPSIKHHILKNQSSTKTESPVKPKKNKTQALKEVTSFQNTGRSSFTSSNKEALLASIMKTCGSPAIPPASSIRSPETPKAVPFRNGGGLRRQLKIPVSSDPEDEVGVKGPASSIKASLEPEIESNQEPSLESREVSSELNPEGTKPTTSTKKPRHKSEKRDRNSLIWRSTGMKPTLPVAYMPGPSNVQKRFHCPVDTCTKAYSRRFTLGQHMNIEHASAIYQDNDDGTLSIVGTKEDQEPDSEEDEEMDDIPAKIEVNKAIAMVIPNGQTTTKDRKHTADDGALDSPAPPKTARGKAKRSNSISSRAREGGSKHTSLKNISNAEVSSYEEPSMIRRSTSTSISSKKALLADPSHSAYAVLPPNARQSRSQSIGNMEPWELAPGRILGSVEGDDDSEEESIAFSSAYITTNDQGIKLDGIKFTVLHLPGGTPYTWTVDETSLRICSIAVGKVRVAIGGKDFTIGAHGMWRIRGGETCNIVNISYGEAVVHVSTVDDK